MISVINQANFIKSEIQNTVSWLRKKSLLQDWVLKTLFKIKVFILFIVTRKSSDKKLVMESFF